MLLFRQNIKYIGGFGDGFNSLYGFENFKEFKYLIKEEANLTKYKDSICCHIRMGDFAMSKDGKISNNTRIPLNWYIEVIENLRKRIIILKFIYSQMVIKMN